MNKQSVKIFAKAFFPVFIFAFIGMLILSYLEAFVGRIFEIDFLMRQEERRGSLVSSALFMGVVLGLGGVYNEYKLHQESQDNIKRVAKVFVLLFFGVFLVLAILPFVALKYIAFLEDFTKSWLEFGLSFPVIIASASAFGLLLWGYFRETS